MTARVGRQSQDKLVAKMPKKTQKTFGLSYDWQPYTYSDIAELAAQLLECNVTPMLEQGKDTEIIGSVWCVGMTAPREVRFNVIVHTGRTPRRMKFAEVGSLVERMNTASARSPDRTGGVNPTPPDTE